MSLRKAAFAGMAHAGKRMAGFAIIKSMRHAQRFAVLLLVLSSAPALAQQCHVVDREVLDLGGGFATSDATRFGGFGTFQRPVWGAPCESWSGERFLSLVEASIGFVAGFDAEPSGFLGVAPALAAHVLWSMFELRAGPALGWHFGAAPGAQLGAMATLVFEWRDGIRVDRPADRYGIAMMWLAPIGGSAAPASFFVGITFGFSHPEE